MMDSGRWKDCLWLSFDTEATGVNPAEARVFEVGYALGGLGGVVDHIGFLISPPEPIPVEVEELTGIKNHMVVDQPNFEAHAHILLKYLRDAAPYLVGYNALHYDVPLLKAEFDRAGISMDPIPPVIDPLILARGLLRKEGSYRLELMAKRFNVELTDAHRAEYDAGATLGVLAAMAPMLPDDGQELLALQDELQQMVDREKAAYGHWLREIDGALIMGCGKHAGTEISKMEPGYLRWMLGLADLPQGTRTVLQEVLGKKR